jgi:hypothetical protein
MIFGVVRIETFNFGIKICEYTKMKWEVRRSFEKPLSECKGY